MGQDVGLGGHEKDIVEGERFLDLHAVSTLGLRYRIIHDAPANPKALARRRLV